MNSAKVRVDHNGKSKEYAVNDDAFANLIKATDDTRGAARVTVTYGQATEYGGEKLHITVTLTCDQNSSTLSEAGYQANLKAQELFKDLSESLSQ
jgi:hypothetical protein